MSLRKEFSWSFLANIAPLAIIPVVLLSLARLLSPSDFGIVSTVMVVISFLKLFRDAGFGQIIIQSHDDNTADFAFTLQFFTSLALVLATIILAPLAEGLFSTSEIVTPIRVASLELLFSPFIDIPILLSMRQISFKSQFIRNSLAPIIAGTTSIPLAYYGFGYWSIIYGTLLGTATVTIILLASTKWKPLFDFNYKKYRTEIRFGFHMLNQSITAWTINSLDKLFLAHHNDTSTVGHYEIASRASRLPFNILSAPTNQLMYPVFRKEAREGREIKHLYLTTTRRVALITLPFTVYLLFNSTSIISLLLGDDWLVINEIFTLLVITIMTATLVTLNAELYKAIDQTTIMTRFMAIRAIASIPVYYYTSLGGATSLALGRAILALAFSPINTAILLHTANIRPSTYARSLYKPATLSLALISLSVITNNLLSNQNHQLTANTALILLLYWHLYQTEFKHLLHNETNQ